MSCWRVLQLSDQLDGENVPQLLIKPRFSSDSYTIFLTDLSNIWSEELDSAGLVGRASEEESPIEVSKQETTQLAILLQNVQKSLANTDDTTCRIVRATADDVVLHTTISLPEPLDSLRWRFHLRKRTSVTLKNELVLPLLVSSHIQHEKISNLVATITEKDRVITRLLDQYESSNLDLAAAFPSISGLKSGRRLLKRDQAARHIPGLQPFHQDSWKRETAELHDTDVSTLSLFQEALSECTPKVPPRLESEDSRNTWWTSIATALHDPKPTMKPKANPIPEKAEARAERKVPAPESDDDETEDEFETHENFKLREAAKTSTHVPDPLPASSAKQHDPSEDESTENDDDDLDAPPKSQSQTRRLRKASARDRTSMADTSSPPSKRATSTRLASPPPSMRSPPVPKAKGKGFRIGGKANKGAAESPALSSEEAQKSPIDIDGGEQGSPIPTRPKTDAVEAITESKPTRKPFRIGGKAKASAESTQAEHATNSARDRKPDPKTTRSPSPKRPLPTVKESGKESTPPEEAREETTEERAERKRRELKRKNEESAKRQAHRKKRRF